MSVQKDFEELFACLNEREVRYLVVGDYAVAYHAKPRYTKDLDLLVDPTPDNADALLAALTVFGFGGIGLTQADFSGPEKIVQLGVPPIRVDLLTSIAGVEFSSAWSARVRGRYGAQPIWFIGRQHLVMSKRAAGRPQDLADLDLLTTEDDGTP